MRPHGSTYLKLLSLAKPIKGRLNDGTTFSIAEAKAILSPEEFEDWVELSLFYNQR